MDKTLKNSTTTQYAAPEYVAPDVDTSAVKSETIIIRDQEYEVLRCLSDNSGEAQVFLVRKDGTEYVLKVYYPTFNVKKPLLKVIANINFEMIVRLYDYGKVYLDGKSRDYELMEYLRGGTLSDYCVNGDEKQFRRIALQAAAAIACCHNNMVIHKDIKPGNLFFRDEACTEIVMADFGISSLFKSDKPTHRTSQARTPIYAAPEMYTDVIDGEVEITPAVDYYSLGMTLLAIWLGQKPMNTNERDMMKRKSEGRLPGIKEMPERVRMIILGLTSVNPAYRWTYNEVEQWFEGGSPEVNTASPWLKYKSFVVDPDRNLVAENVHELIPMLMENESIARGYLYSGRITQWLEVSGNTKLSTLLKDIVTSRYAHDQQAGLMAAVYAMEPTYPYKDLHGNLCDDVRSIVISLMKYSEEYAMTLRNPNDSLWLYVESHSQCNVARMREYFVKRDGFDGKVAVARCVYELDDELPFLPQYPSSTLSEIVQSFGSGNLNEDAWRSLCDGRLLSWMYSHADMMACESLRILTDGQEYSKHLAYKVLYNIDKSAAYDLKDAHTPEAVGELLTDKLLEWQNLSDEEFANAVSEFADTNGRFQFFAQLHGWFEQKNEAVRCFDLNSEENRERLGAYDLRVAAYRFCMILGGAPKYRLSSGVLLADGRQVPGKCRSEIRTELRTGSFAQWLTIFYHENPHTDFSEEYSYERALEQWIMAVGEFDAQYTYHKRYTIAKESTRNKYKEVKHNYVVSRRNELTWKVVYYAFCAIWLYLLVKFGISNRNALLDNLLLAVFLPVGGVSACIVAAKGFFKGYGVLMILLFGLLGSLMALVPAMTLWLASGVSDAAFMGIIVGFTLISIVIHHVMELRRERREDVKLMNQVIDDDIKSNLIEPLYYTFKTKSFKYKGAKFGVLDEIQDRLKGVSNESVLHNFLWTLLMVLLVLEMVMFHPRLLNVRVPHISDKVQVSPGVIYNDIMEKNK